MERFIWTLRRGKLRSTAKHRCLPPASRAAFGAVGAVGTILSRSELERQIYGWNEEVESNAIEFLIHTIRKNWGATVIRNVRGVGWMVDRSL